MAPFPTKENGDPDFEKGLQDLHEFLQTAFLVDGPVSVASIAESNAVKENMFVFKLKDSKRGTFYVGMVSHEDAFRIKGTERIIPPGGPGITKL